MRVTRRPSAQEELEQLEFARLKLDRLSAPAHRSRDEVHLEIADLEQGLRSAQSRTPGKRGKARHQFLEGEGLDDMVVPAGLEFLDPVVDAGEVGEKEHRRREAILPHQRDDAEAVEFRQHPIEHNHVEAIDACPLVAFPTVVRHHRLMTVFTGGAAGRSNSRREHYENLYRPP